METITVDIQNEEEKKVLLAFLDSLNYRYSIDNNDYVIPDKELNKMTERRNDFLTGKTTSRPWSEIRKQYPK
jgi:hypothetical protein